MYNYYNYLGTFCMPSCNSPCKQETGLCPLGLVLPNDPIVLILGAVALWEHMRGKRDRSWGKIIVRIHCNCARRYEFSLQSSLNILLASCSESCCWVNLRGCWVPVWRWHCCCWVNVCSWWIPEWKGVVVVVKFLRGIGAVQKMTVLGAAMMDGRWWQQVTSWRPLATIRLPDPRRSSPSVPAIASTQWAGSPISAPAPISLHLYVRPSLSVSLCLALSSLQNPKP